MFDKYTKLKLSDEAYGIVCMLGCCFFYAALNCLARYTSHTVHPITMVFYRNFIALILILPFVLKTIPRVLNLSAFNKLNLARGIGGFLSMVFWFLALSGLPITEVVSLSFLTPIFACILAAIVFGEKLRRNKILALIIGFAGTYVILQPDVKGINIYVIYVLLSCVIWASTNIMVKNLTKYQDPYTIVFYMAFVITPISFPWLIANWYVPNLKEFILLTAIALCSNIAQILIAKAYVRTMVSTVMPFDFTRLIFSSILAYIMFGEVIEPITLIGSTMIIYAGYMVAKKEFKAKSPKQIVTEVEAS